MFGQLGGTLVGVGLLCLGAILVATARPRWIILTRRNREVPASVRWTGAEFLVVGSEWIALTWVAQGYDLLVIAVTFVGVIACGAMARITRGGFKVEKVTTRSQDEGEFGVTRTTLAGVIRRLASSRSTYMGVLLSACFIVPFVVVINQTPSETITIRETGSQASVSLVITGKTPFVVRTENQIMSGASTSRADGVNITTTMGDTHIGADYCQYTIPNTAGTTRLTVYSTSTALGDATCSDLQSLGFY